MPISRGSNLRNTAAREENIHDLASPWTELPMQFPTNGIPIDQEENILSTKSPQLELLRCNYQLWNCYFTRLWIFASLGTLTRKILKLKPPKCSGWLHITMTKRQCRTKSESNRGTMRKAYAPVYCGSGDQMDLSTSGFIYQVKGKPTKNRCRNATIFLYHHNDLTYMHL